MQSKHTLRLGAAGRVAVRRKLRAWFAVHGRDLPWRRTRDPYAVMVSEFMLQQTQVATVLEYYRCWMERFPDFARLAAASEDEVLHAWEGLGYYSRARNLHRAAQAVTAQYAGKLPDDVEVIRRLPGIGRYTAGAIASFAFDRATPIVDANIARVLSRLLNLQEPIDSARGAAAVWNAASELLPARSGRAHNSALMELGALVCLPRSPRCRVCPIHAHCAAPNPEMLPVKRARRKIVALTEECAWTVDRGRLLLERQTGTRWRGLWKLPAICTAPSAAEPLAELQYPFTHHRVSLRVFAAPPPPMMPASQQWFAIESLASMALPSPHRRAVQQILAAV